MVELRRHRAEKSSRLGAGAAGGAVTHWQTHGERAVHEALTAVYPNARAFEPQGGDGAAHFACSVLRLGRFSIHRAVTSGYRCKAEPNDAVRLTLPLRGHVSVTTARGETIAVARMSGLACVNDVVDREVGIDYCGFHFQVPKVELLAAARTLTGDEYGLEQIADAVDLRSAMGAALLRNIASLFTEAERLAELGLGQVAAAGAGDLVLNLAVAALIPDLRERIAGPPARLGRGAIEHARQFIDAHADEPLRLGVLAEQLGVSLRTLQAGFRRQFGCTLSDYLFKRRLELARSSLLTEGDATTITAVALRCGFVNAGAFAARYFRAFGELPSETVHRVRRSSQERARLA